MKDLYIPPLLVIHDYEAEAASETATTSVHDNAYVDADAIP